VLTLLLLVPYLQLLVAPLCVCARAQILRLGHIRVCSHGVFSITFLSDLRIRGILNSFRKYYHYNLKQDQL
jgi:hypothetical protein